PAERRRLRRVVDRGTSLLRRSRRSTIDQVQLVAVGVTLNVVSEQRTVSEAERLARLLTELKARNRLSGTVALRELVGVRKRLDSGAILLVRGEVQVLDVVGILRRSLGT